MFMLNTGVLGSWMFMVALVVNLPPLIFAFICVLAIMFWSMVPEIRMSVISSTPVFLVFTMGSCALKLILYLGLAMVPLNCAVAFRVPSSFSSSGMRELNFPSGSLLILAVPLSLELLCMVSMRLLSSSHR